MRIYTQRSVRCGYSIHSSRPTVPAQDGNVAHVRRPHHVLGLGHPYTVERPVGGGGGKGGRGEGGKGEGGEEGEGTMAPLYCSIIKLSSRSIESMYTIQITHINTSTLHLHVHVHDCSCTKKDRSTESASGDTQVALESTAATETSW